MKTSKHASPAGRWIKTLDGYKAYQPNPLPPEIVWTPRLVRILSQADQLLRRLAGEGRQLPNPHVLIRPFVRREAVYSSRIEGTQATLGELLAAEAGAVPARSPEDLREVGNYVAALEHGIKRLKTLPLSLRLVRELHQKLMTGVRGDQATPGEFRRTQNWIGRTGCTLADASYVPPPPAGLLTHLGRWEKFLHDETIPPLVHAALMHYQFEAIHPFLDGNGQYELLYDKKRLALPVFHAQTGHSGELCGIVRHDDRPKPQRLRGKHQIVGANRLSIRLEFGQMSTDKTVKIGVGTRIVRFIGDQSSEPLHAFAECRNIGPLGGAVFQLG